MKLYSILFLTCVTLSNIAQALPLNSPSKTALLQNSLFLKTTDTDAFSTIKNQSNLQFSLYGDYIFDRKLKSKFNGNNLLNNSDNTVSSDRIKKANIYTSAALLNYNFFDAIDIFGTIGCTTVNLNSSCSMFSYSIDDLTSPFFINYSKTQIPLEQSATPTYNKSPATSNYHLNSKNNLSWGTGLKLTFFKHKNLTASIQGQYNTFVSKNINIINAPFNIIYSLKTTSSISVQETTARPSAMLNTSLHYQEWNIGGALSYKIHNISPYIGIKMSSAKFYSKSHLAEYIVHTKVEDTTSTTGFNTKKHSVRGLLNSINQQPFGAVLGLNTILLDKIVIGVEGRYGDEKALSASVQIKF